VFNEHPLVDKIITPLPGHEGNLVNSICLKRKKGTCVEWKWVDYSFKDQKVIDTLQEFKFVCKLGSKMYVPCLNGFCRYTYERSWFLAPSKPKLEEFKSIEDYSFLLEAKTMCFNFERYPFYGFD